MTLSIGQTRRLLFVLLTGATIALVTLAAPGAIPPSPDTGLEGAIGRAASAFGTTEFVGWIVVTLIGLLGAAFFAGAETGLYSVNRVRLRLRSTRERPRDHLARILAGEIEKSDRSLPAMLIGFNVCSAVMALGLTAILTDRGYTEAGLIWINVFLVTPLTFVLCDTLPKEVFRADADRLTYASSPAVRLWRNLLTFTGVLPLIRLLAAGIARLVARGQADAPEASRQRIARLLKEGAQSGVISEQQLGLLDRAFALREAVVGDEMIPWAKVAAIEASWSREQIIAYIQKHPSSRFPVIGDRGNERGLLLGVSEHLDLCTRLAEVSLRELTKPTLVLPPDLPVREALKRLGASGSKMAIVARAQPPRPIGLVTLKDLVEPLTGEVRAW